MFRQDSDMLFTICYMYSSIISFKYTFKCFSNIPEIIGKKDGNTKYITKIICKWEWNVNKNKIIKYIY